MIQSVQIFYFSGTGNARKITKWLAEYAESKSILSKIYDISKIDKENINLSTDGLIIFISPIHGFNYPKITLDFLRKFPHGKNRVVLMNTRGGMRIGNFVTPGLTGIAFFISSILLKFKGYKIVGQIPFDMPSNWISVHPALNEKTVKYLHTKNYSKTIKHAKKIFSGKKDFLAMRDILQDILLTPISVLYFLVGRFIFAKTFYASHKCDNCNLCINECPVKAIIKINDRPFWTFHCESCMKCMNNCPQRAIETAHGLFIILIILSPFFSSLLLNEYIKENYWLSFIVKNFIFLSALMIIYRIQNTLLRNKVVSKFISYTSFTYYKFWGRYKSISDNKWKQIN